MRVRKRMQRRYHSVKGRIVGLLSGVLTFGMAAGIIPGGTETVLNVQAAEAINEPSVTDYATKDKMMDGPFKTGSNGVGQNIGKLIFGKNSKGEAQEWYILKKDYFATQNTLIFAASPITTGVQFHSTSADYPNGIHANYYFNSDLDKLLANMAGDTQFFSTKEQELLGETEINTKDGKAKRKLYALSGSYTTNNNIILAGEYNDIKISIANYCSGSDAGEFWLRSATDMQDADEEEKAQCVLVVDPSQKKVARAELVTEKFDVWPAVDLDLSNVLFASSYDGSNINNRDGMILRLDGKNKDIGTVTYNPRTNKVTVERGNVSGNVRLVVQYGKNANEREIFTSVIGTSAREKTLTGSEIFGNVNISEDDWSKCKIWLEITDDDGMIYAVEATEDTNPTTIDSIVAKIDEPEAGKLLSTSVDAGDHVTTEITWTYEGQTVLANEKAKYYPACYTAHITFVPAEGYGFSDSTKIQINGSECEPNLLEGKITAERYFYSSWDKLISITAPASITVANGTAYEDMNLPAQVGIVTEGSTVNKADVSWNTGAPVSGSYDPNILTEQTVTLKGKVTCPETINVNGVNLTTSITITISAAEDKHTVEAPIARPEAGTYTENQTVTLKSATEGAVIYYTTNGAEPSSTTGTQYTGPITAAGMEGQSVETNIKAIAVKSGMQDSLVMTYKYTIELPSQTPEIKAPVITSQPQDIAVKAGETATFTVVATGTGLTYQWERDTGNGFKEWGGIYSKSASFTTGVLSKGCNGYKYRCIVSNSAGPVTSDSATLTVIDDATPPSETTYIITAAAGANGSISPSGSVEVKKGADQTFTITADEGYEIENLKVDGSDVSAASSYTFNNVTEAHRIEATFKQKVTNPDPGQPENPDPGKPEDPNPAEKPKPEVKKDETPASSQAPLHEHSFNWVTVQTASAMQDGLEELRCSCGIVKECSVVPASQAYVNELYQNLSQALAEGEVSFDSGRIYTISDYLIRKLQERADVTTTITFEYNQDKYRMMIPAGVDYSELLEDEDYFYGYFYFAKKVGARVESL
ncbi:hypothetical protein DXB46_11575 [Lachnospiraceae bacterium OM04-12BH]|nr:hypothetical protein DXB46_11575 [Lachnospiraceae bacterium OM04-12BH]